MRPPADRRYVPAAPPRSISSSPPRDLSAGIIIPHAYALREIRLQLDLPASIQDLLPNRLPEEPVRFREQEGRGAKTSPILHIEPVGFRMPPYRNGPRPEVSPGALDQPGDLGKAFPLLPAERRSTVKRTSGPLIASSAGAAHRSVPE